MFDSQLRRHQDWDLIFRMIESGVAMVLLSDATTRYYTPVAGNAGNVGVFPSLLPSFWFLAKHGSRMSVRSRVRFVALQVMRRRGIGIRVARYLLCARMLGGMSFKELAYYFREALLADMDLEAAVKRKPTDVGRNSTV